VIRSRLSEAVDVRIAAAADELEALATEPDNRTVALDPACAVACL
jgi:hypothetical protein